MRKIPKKIPAVQLRRMDPVLALNLETTQLIFDAESADLVYRITRSRKKTTFYVALSDHHMMRISPIRRSHDDVFQWGTYAPSRRIRDHIDFYIHAHIQIFKQKKTQRDRLDSFTTQAPDLKHLIRHALYLFYDLSGIRLVPLEKGNPE